MIDITIKVPEERVAEFYAMYGHWLASPGGATGPPGVDVEPSEAVEWGEGDVELAATVWKKFSPRAKALFSTLIDNPEDKFTGDVLAEMHEIPNGRYGVAGVLAWPSRHCFAVGRRYCWRWAYPEGETAVYWMEAPVAAVFRKARG